MGGFHLLERSSEGTSNGDRGMSRGDDKPIHPLQASDLVQFDGYSKSFIMPAEAEIKGEGKSNWLAKSLVLPSASGKPRIFLKALTALIDLKHILRKISEIRSLFLLKISR